MGSLQRLHRGSGFQQNQEHVSPRLLPADWTKKTCQLPSTDATIPTMPPVPISAAHNQISSTAFPTLDSAIQGRCLFRA